MEFLKKHYEKLILSVVLLGLAAVAAWLPIKVSQEKETEENRKKELIGAKVNPLQPIDLTTNQNVLAKVKSPIKFDIAGKHNLFNPVPWVKYPNGDLIKVRTGNEVGVGALDVVSITPMNMTISFDGVVGDPALIKNPEDYKYQITVNRQGGSKSTRAFAVRGANAMGALKEIKGPTEAPTNVVFQLAGKQESIVISKEKPYVEVIGYSADLQYAPPNTPPMAFKDQRTGDTIRVGTYTYKIVAIDKAAVVFSDATTQKRTIKNLTLK